MRKNQEIQRAGAYPGWSGFEKGETAVLQMFMDITYFKRFDPHIDTVKTTLQPNLDQSGALHIVFLEDRSNPAKTVVAFALIENSD